MKTQVGLTADLQTQIRINNFFINLQNILYLFSDSLLLEINCTITLLTLKARL